MSELVEQHRGQMQQSCRCCVITISDSRTLQTDSGGALIVERLTAAGHVVQRREIIADEPQLIATLLQQCDADAAIQVVLFTGGTGISGRDQTYGTLDEALEVLTLIQTGKRDLVPVILADAPGGNYWKTLDHFIREHLLLDGMISADDLHLYSITDNYREATEEIRKYYRVFHSLRYVGRNLVLRLNYELSESLLTTINQDFSDLLNGGKYQQQGKLEEEKDDERTDDLPRLVFLF